MKRIGVAVAAVAAATALALTGCSNSGSGGSDNGEIKKNVAVTVAQNQPFTASNSNQTNNYTTYNSNVTYFTWSQFNYYDSTPKLVKNTKFGTYKVESKDPLTIKYTINKGVKWSDGTQVGAADMLLVWASGQSKYNDPKGVNFNSVTAGSLDLASEVPQIGDDGRSITLKYDQPYSAWEVNFSMGIAAHQAYIAAFPGTKPADANAAFIKAVQTGDTATLAKVGKAFDTAFTFSGDLPSDKNLYLSDGAYVITDLKKDQYVTLTKNKDYTWGPKPTASKVTFRNIPDQTAQVQALQNGEIQLTYGQATQDTVAALKGLKNVTTKTDSGASYEHVDLTMDNDGPFSPKSYGGDANKAKLVRQAFLKALPRQQIVDNLIKPIQSDAKLDDSQTILPGAAGYEDSVADNGAKDYDKVDIDAAKSLLQQAGVTTPVKVRFMYAKSNPRRASEYALVKASEAKAGFDVIDQGDDSWSDHLGNGQYDVALFAWQYSSLSPLGAEYEFITGGNSNFSGYSNATVDADYKKLEGEFDTSKQNALLADIDKQLWSDAYGATLFQFPDVTAYTNSLKGVKYSPISPNAFWNYWDWTK